MTGPAAQAGPDADLLAVYVHWPFCRSKCPYCDFNSHVRTTVDQARWRAAYLRELGHFSAETIGRTVGSVFFGGGTPSLMPAATVAAILDGIAGTWRLAGDVEVTLEANPTSTEAKALSALRNAGINRVSLGVQALDDDALRFLGREHGAAEALRAVAVAARLFDRYSFDLIYARPGQSPRSWRQELSRALAAAGGHLSVYQLTIEPGTAFESLARRGLLTVPDDDIQAALYEATQEILGGAGLPAYEISNHARPGEASRHNLVYWRYGDYLGIGPGAHGRLRLPSGRVATRTHRAPEIWLDRVERDGHGEHAREPIDPETAAAEALMMGLRLADGVCRETFRQRIGRDPLAFVDGAAADRLIGGGFLAVTGRHIGATAAGRQRLGAVTAALLG